ncbi:gustatory receptor 5a for trehalose-like [Ostrinia furnacalis]|uniref:gustatory receptor 5a for trehalose-like n=1 Tax=Ostrinia furnacalis TaxID=93504 RepID=UPI00103E67F6|nr:gustatory receptor 5a for trehalose-like [Ostrinia furnacalis]
MSANKNTSQNKLILPDQPYHDTFLNTMSKTFLWARLFGVMSKGSRWWNLWAIILLGTLLIIEIAAIWKVIKALAGWAVDTAGHRSVTARLSGTMFYSTVIASQILCSRLSLNWNTLSSYWMSIERAVAINTAPDQKIRTRMITAMSIMAVLSTFEHLISIIALIGFDCPSHLILRRYTARSHGFLFLRDDYSVWFAVPLLFISNIATILWNFQDTLVILICMGLSSRYSRLNKYVASVCVAENKIGQENMKAEVVRVYSWRKIREAYVKQAALVRKLDEALGEIILLTSFGNFYFICLQLFLGITEGLSSTSTLKLVYYLVSSLWLVIRFTWMVLAAADVHVHSRHALQYLHSCNSKHYNVEIERLQNQLNKDYVALTGVGFFSIEKNILLRMAAAVVTYELVLIQFDDKGSSDIPSNSTGLQ